MPHTGFPILLLAVLAQAPAAPPEAAGGLPELRPGVMVQVTTGRETVTGTVEDAPSLPGLLRLRPPGASSPIYVRRSAVETIRVIPDPADIRATSAVAGPDPNRHLVYVHGICKHSAGFSKPWFEAMKGFTPQIAPANVHEVVWSDIVNPESAAVAAASAQPQNRTEEQKRLAESLKAVLRDRTDQAEAESGEGVTGAAPTAAVPGHDVRAEGFLSGITESVECADDFVLYMTVTSIREQILDRFDRVVRPLLQGGAVVEVISHSWGTVVAYEGLRRLENPGPSSPPLKGVVHNLFTVGSALSIGPVKVNLFGRVPGSSRPQRVNRWVNIDAHFDVVGGHMQGAPFAVDVEQLRLPPVGCTFPVTPTCAHGSYFDPRNIRVNRDIFGLFIGQ
jgi:hypothetical protein